MMSCLFLQCVCTVRFRVSLCHSGKCTAECVFVLWLVCGFVWLLSRVSARDDDDVSCISIELQLMTSFVND